MCGLSCLLLLLLSLCSLRGLCQVLSGLQCFRPGPDSGMNCTWTVEGKNRTDIVYTFYYRSLKYSQLSSGQYCVPLGQTWVIIARENLTAYDRCQVKVEGITADGRIASQSREMDINAIVVPSPPKLSVEAEPSQESGNVMVSCEPSSTWYGFHPLQCELQYREQGTNEWSKVISEGSSSSDNEILDLAPFTLYEVRGRYLRSEGNEFGSDWSELFTFRSPEAGPLGKVDIWRSVEHGGSSLLLMWKPLCPSAARSHHLNFSLNYRERGGSFHVLKPVPCCNISLPGNVDYVSVSASNSVGQLEPSNISLEFSDLPAPTDLQVHSVNWSGLNVSWIPVNQLNEELEEYLVEWRLAELPGPEIVHWRRIAASQGIHSILLTGDTLKAEMPYNISVYALYSRGFGGPNSKLCYIREGVPSRGPPVTVHVLSSSTVLVTLGELHLLERRGIITHYTVYITRGETKTMLKKQNFSIPNVTISELEPSTQYQVHVTASTSAGESPIVDYPFLTPGGSHGTVLPFIIVTLCLLTLCILGIVFRRWIRTQAHDILPMVCWQKIPDPVHSKLVLNVLNRKDISEWSGFIVSNPDLHGELEEPPISKVEEVAEPLPDPSASVNQRGPEQDENGDRDPPQSPTTNPERCDSTKTNQLKPSLVEWRPPIISGYERHFMPSPEDLGLYT